MSNSSLKKILRYSLFVSATILAVLATYLFAAWSLGQWRVNTARTDGMIAVYVVSNGVHTDIVMPMDSPQWHWRDWVSEMDTRQPQAVAQYVSIGWGDRGFYLETPTWADLKASTAVKAISGLNQTAMHVTFSTVAPDEHNPQIAKILLMDNEYRALAEQVSHSFARKNGKTRRIQGAAYTDFDVFYEANGRYSALMTCNTWTNQQLKQSGLPAVMWTVIGFQAAFTR